MTHRGLTALVALKAAGLALMFAAVCNSNAQAGSGPPPPGTPTTPATTNCVVPEIDFGAALGAGTLLAGGMLVLTDRCRMK